MGSSASSRGFKAGFCDIGSRGPGLRVIPNAINVQKIYDKERGPKPTHILPPKNLVALPARGLSPVTGSLACCDQKT